MNLKERIQLIIEASPSELKQIDDILLGKTNAPFAIPAEQDVRTCTQPEAARRLGVSRSTIHRMMQDGRLEYTIVNKNPRIVLASILQYGCSHNPTHCTD